MLLSLSPTEDCPSRKPVRISAGRHLHTRHCPPQRIAPVVSHVLRCVSSPHLLSLSPTEDCPSRKKEKIMKIIAVIAMSLSPTEDCPSRKQTHNNRRTGSCTKSLSPTEDCPSRKATCRLAKQPIIGGHCPPQRIAPVVRLTSGG